MKSLKHTELNKIIFGSICGKQPHMNGKEVYREPRQENTLYLPLS